MDDHEIPQSLEQEATRPPSLAIMRHHELRQEADGARASLPSIQYQYALATVSICLFIIMSSNINLTQ